MKIRRTFIEDSVKRYQEQNAEEFESFLKFMEWRRAELADKNYAELNNTTEIRHAFSMPPKLYHAITYVLDGFNEPKFGEPKGEMKWFLKKFPQYQLAVKY